MIIAGIIIRLLQGIASASIQTTCYTIAINDFKDKTIQSKIVAYVEAMTGIGLILGPMLGGLLYSAIGFSNVFYLLGSFVIVMSIIFCIYYPRKQEELIPDSASFTSNQLLNSTSAGRGAVQ